MNKIRFSIVVMVLAIFMAGAFASCRQDPTKLPSSLVPPEQILKDPPQTNGTAQVMELPQVKVTRMDRGDNAPDFSLQTLDGQILTLSQFRGKNVVLNFWVAACPACLEELPYFQTVHNKLPADKTVILAVNAGERDKLVQYEAQRMKLTYPVLLDPDGKVCKSYGRGSPTTFFIDSNGIIREIVDEVFESPAEIENILKLLSWL